MGKINQYLDKISEYGADNYLDKQEEKELDDLRAKLELNYDDITEANRRIRNLKMESKSFDIKQYENKLRQFGEDCALSPEEEAELKKIKDELNLSDEDVSGSMVDLIHLKKMHVLRNEKLPALDVNIILKNNEICHYEIRCDLVEEKSKTRYVGSSQGVSLRIMKGVSYRIGGFKGERIVDTYTTITDSGTLYITNKRIVFVGLKKNVTYPLDKIVNFTKYLDAICFQKENETKQKLFKINDTKTIDEIGVLLARVVSS